MTSVKKSNLKLILTLMTVITVVVVIGLFFNIHKAHQTEQLAHQIKIDGTILSKSRRIHPFQLTDETGKSFSNTNLKGHWTLMFFGFTNCGYVCPTTLSALGKMYTNLSAHLPPALLPQVVMVSVDPERDSVQRLKAYVKTFNPAFVGVRGSIEQTKTLANQMSVVFMKIKHSVDYI